MEKALRIIDSQRLSVGESPVWDEQTSRLYTIDIRGKCVRVTDWPTGDLRQIDLPQQVGCVVLTEDGNLIAAMEDGVYLVKDGGAMEKINREVTILGRRFNDGKAGPDGRLYVGTTDVHGEGAFYRMDHDGTMTMLFDHVGVSNGLAWSSDGKTMYYCDSNTKLVEAFDFCGETGTLSNRRTVLEMPFETGIFDGMTIDAEDKLWVAVWDGACILQVDPATGSILDRIDVPVSRSACCAFVGDTLEQMVITTAAFQKDDEPDAGKTFLLEKSVKGTLGHRFKMTI